jgi:ATP-dependent DNA ligase
LSSATTNVRLFPRNGHDWTDRYPLIVEAALKNRSSSFVIDGEAVSTPQMTAPNPSPGL